MALLRRSWAISPLSFFLVGVANAGSTLAAKSRGVQAAHSPPAHAASSGF
jgi:hypothetical protein